VNKATVTAVEGFAKKKISSVNNALEKVKTVFHILDLCYKKLSSCILVHSSIKWPSPKYKLSFDIFLRKMRMR
jgi:hypothetical protein